MAKRRGFPGDEMPLPTAPGWVPVFNTTQETIPGFGVMVFSPERSAYINGPAGANDYYTEAWAGQSVVRVKKCDSAFLALSERSQAARIWINGPTPILPLRPGIGTRQWPAAALVFSDDATLPISGDHLGLVENKWYLTVASTTNYLPSSSYPAGPAIARFLCWEGNQIKSILATEPRIAMIDQVVRSGVPFKNESGETCPAWGVMRVTGGAVSGGENVLTIEKPSTTFQRLYLVNGPSDVADDAIGYGTWLSDAGFVLYDTANTPAYGESWGPKASQWTIAKWRYGFTIMGANGGSGSTSRAWAKQQEVDAFIGITDETIALDADGACGIYDGNDADTTNTMADVVNRYATSIASGTKVDVVWRGGKWYIIAVRC